MSAVPIESYLPESLPVLRVVPAVVEDVDDMTAAVESWAPAKGDYHWMAIMMALIVVAAMVVASVQFMAL